MTACVTSCGRILLEKPTAIKLVKEFLTFIEPESSFSGTKEPASVPYPEAVD
jgi:hypothetical protein